MLQQKVLFSPKDCSYIRSFFDESTEVEGHDTLTLIDTIGQAKYNKEIGEEEANADGTLIVRWRKDSNATWIQSEDQELKDFIVEKLSPWGIASCPTIKVMKYNVGHKLTKHLDFSKYGSQIIYRSFSAQLSGVDDYDGGILRTTGKGDGSKELGNAIMFPPTLEHEVTEITSGSRYALVIFFEEEHFENSKSLILSLIHI